MKKALVSLAIEQTLLEIGGEKMLDEVSNIMLEEYNCGIPDCFEHPEYLNKVLKNLFGNSYYTIVQSIKKQLDEFSYQEPIAEFLTAMEA